MIALTGSKFRTQTGLQVSLKNVHHGHVNFGGQVVDQEIHVTRQDHLDLAAHIVSAFVRNNSVPMAELLSLIAQIHGALTALGSPPPTEKADTAPKPTPAQVRKSVTADALVSFIDGKPYKTLKRHLGIHGFDSYAYRERYGLPPDYPMVAANYAKQRSDLAKALGLGQRGGKPSAQPVSRPPVASPKRRRKAAAQAAD